MIDEKTESVHNLRAEFDVLVKKFITDDKYPFLKHLAYFGDDKNNGEISASSISCKWSKLTRMSGVLTYGLGLIAIKGANVCANPQIKYCDSFCPAQMMHNLKHPSDSQIVNADGSINRDTLLKFVENYFLTDGKGVYVKHDGQYIILQSVTPNFLDNFSKRDVGLKKKFHILLPDSDTAAEGEWTELFNSLCDGQYTSGPHKKVHYLTLQSLIMFYYANDKFVEKIFRSRETKSK